MTDPWRQRYTRVVQGAPAASSRSRGCVPPDEEHVLTMLPPDLVGCI